MAQDKQTGRNTLDRGDGMYEDDPNALVPKGVNDSSAGKSDDDALKDNTNGGFYKGGAGQSGNGGSSAAATPTPGQLDSAESAPTTSSDNSAENDEKKGLYSGEEHRRRLALWGSSRKGIIGSVIGLSLGGGIFFGGGVLSGPFQIIHMAHLMQQFHLNQQSDDADNRLGKLVRFARYANKGKVENTRLGFLGNHYADIAEKKLNATGITSTYDKTTGAFQGYTIDPEVVGTNAEAVKAEYKAQYGIDLTETKDGKLFATSSDLIGLKGYLLDRKLISTSMQKAGYKGVTGAIMKRIAGKRAGLTWHPLQRKDSQLRQSAADLFNKLKDKWTTNVDQGAIAEEEGIGTPTEENTNGQPPTDQQTANNDNAQTETSNASNTQTAAEAGDGTKFKGSLGKIAGGGAAALGVACFLQSIAKGAQQLKYAQTVLPLMRMGFEMVSLGNQLMSGNDVDISQVGFFSQFLYDQVGKTSWAGAQSIQGELGETITGASVNSLLTGLTAGTALSFLLPGHSALGTGLDVACGAIVSTILNVVSFLAGPISWAAGTALSLALNQILEQTGILTNLMREVAGKALDPNSFFGGSFGDAVNYGNALVGDDSFLAAGGTALAPTVVAQQQAQQAQETQDEFQQQSFFARMFSPSDSQSIVGSYLDAQNPMFSSSLTGMADDISNVGSLLLSGPAKLLGTLTGTAKAATPAKGWNYGFPIYGFSDADMSAANVQDPYQNANDVLNMLGGSDTGTGTPPAAPDSGAIISAAKTCFNVTLGTDGSVNPIGQIGDSITQQFGDKNGNPYPSADCASGKVANLSESSWNQVRMYIFDSETSDSMSCFQGDDTSCNDVGFGNGPMAGSAGSSTTPTTPGTYQNPLRGLTSLRAERIDGGVDYNANDGPIYAVGDAKIVTVEGLGSNSGWPRYSTGENGGAYIVYQLTDGPAQGKYIYVAEDCAPAVTVGQANVTSNTVLCNFHDEGSAMEIGWGNGSNSYLTTDYHDHGGGSYASNSGQDFSKFLESLPNPPPPGQIQGTKSTVPMPAGWPTW